MEKTITWQKSSKSTDSEGNCLEVSRLGEDILIRESDDPSVVIRTSPDKLRAFITDAVENTFDTPS
ncbi:DUF397 domain-containing protein [Streptomyces mobaraensis NBRC 13819 = DSM 40847]|uniref:DUF397 domain-containing protein n=1 Tax=Streptomyces mobaraensis TaxID=35621 RepID=A0A5N5WFB8_STRMB|nr:DUF397 domain-containing protein [Streptomyces mobaraensis]KAB7852742.1 DUF397 domain-containing protein [Streptomyces mobaraensis]QTT75252.1 DUF397 domain-containing protein [Streptomyces mobaraensis NBRC 13819 = DSM 40847]